MTSKRVDDIPSTTKHAIFGYLRREIKKCIEECPYGFNQTGTTEIPLALKYLMMKYVLDNHVSIGGNEQ